MKNSPVKKSPAKSRPLKSSPAKTSPVKSGPGKDSPARWYSRRWLLATVAAIIVAVVATLLLLRLGSGSSSASTDVPAVPAPTASGLSGYAFQDRNNNGIKDPDEPVLPGATVAIFSTGPLALTTIHTDRAGVFSIAKVDNVTPGVPKLRLEVRPVME